jgi:hypothetical protein
MTMHDLIIYFKPAPEISGYVVICDSILNFGGTLPAKSVAPIACTDTVT